MWATGGMRKLFRGIMCILKTYQDFARMVRLNGNTVAVNPQEWAQFDDWDVNINTGLGTGTRERDFALLGAVVQKQEQIIQVEGPNGPLVTVGQYAAALHDWIEAAGINNPQKYIQSIPANFKMPPPAPPQPSPDVQLGAQVEGAKAQARIQEAAAKIQSDERIALAKIASEERVALAKLELDAMGSGIDAEKIRAEWARIGIDAKQLEHEMAKASKNKEAA